MVVTIWHELNDSRCYNPFEVPSLLFLSFRFDFLCVGFVSFTRSKKMNAQMWNRQTMTIGCIGINMFHVSCIWLRGNDLNVKTVWKRIGGKRSTVQMKENTEGMKKKRRQEKTTANWDNKLEILRWSTFHYRELFPFHQLIPIEIQWKLWTKYMMEWTIDNIARKNSQWKKEFCFTIFNRVKILRL